MMQLDPYTAVFVSSAITMATSLSVFFFSLTKKENRFFIWAALASGGLAGAQFLPFLKGKLPDFFTIIVGEQLATFCLIAFLEVIRRLISVHPKERFIGPSLLVIQFGFFFWYTYFEPNIFARVFFTFCTFIILTFFIMKLLLTNPPNDQLLLHIFAAIPFSLLFLISIIQIISFISGYKFTEDPYSLPTFSLFAISYGVESIWMTLSLVFIVSSRLQSQVTEMALTDPLTGALNRRALKDFAEREIARAKRTGAPLSLIITDLDHFKKINDLFGHQAGDAVLVNTIKIYKALLRAEDVLARYGGEEFVVLLPGADVKKALCVAERLREACKANPLLFEDHSILVTSSFGVAGYLDNSIDYEALVKKADDALYRAKEDGRDRVFAL